MGMEKIAEYVWDERHISQSDRPERCYKSIESCEPSQEDCNRLHISNAKLHPTRSRVIAKHAKEYVIYAKDPSWNSSYTLKLVWNEALMVSLLVENAGGILATLLLRLGQA